MRISRLSAASVGAGLYLLGGVALAQDQRAAPERSPDKPATSREAIESEGTPAMERLRDAVRRRKDSGDAVTGPSMPSSPSEAIRRRAFDAMRRRVPAPAMDARARAALADSEAKMAAAREAMAKRLNQALGLEVPDMAAVAKATSPATAKAWVPVLFVSSSMPVTTLRTYAAQIERAGGVLAFRGMPGGLTKVAPMAKLSAEILRLDPGCEGPACAMRNVQLIVDPIVFRQHGVMAVPALAMIPGDPAQPYCERDEESPRAAHIIYGDAALSGLLEEYARLGGREEVRDAQARLERR